MYLLDVNVLLALAYWNHSLHGRATHWARQVKSVAPTARPFVSCSIVEIGFVRVASRSTGLATNLAAARTDLGSIRATLGLDVLGDSLDGDQFPSWVTRSDQTTDGHLLQLANHHQIRFATLDTGIPGAELIPYEMDFPSKVREPAYARYSDMKTKPGPDKAHRPIPEHGGYPSWIFDDPRWIIDPESGMPCVRRTPGTPMVTSEDVKEALRDFP